MQDFEFMRCKLEIWGWYTNASYRSLPWFSEEGHSCKRFGAEAPPGAGKFWKIYRIFQRKKYKFLKMLPNHHIFTLPLGQIPDFIEIK